MPAHLTPEEKKKSIKAEKRRSYFESFKTDLDKRLEDSFNRDKYKRNFLTPEGYYQ